MTGTVKSVNKEKGYGFLVGADKAEYFFHRSACQNIDFNDLERGREVTFEESEGPKGPRAEEIYA